VAQQIQDQRANAPGRKEFAEIPAHRRCSICQNGRENPQSGAIACTPGLRLAWADGLHAGPELIAVIGCCIEAGPDRFPFEEAIEGHFPSVRGSKGGVTNMKNDRKFSMVLNGAPNQDPTRKERTSNSVLNSAAHELKPIRRRLVVARKCNWAVGNPIIPPWVAGRNEAAQRRSDQRQNGRASALGQMVQAANLAAMDQP
jgi:hypothetical protein